MNDEIRERLSAYLDGALSDAERGAVEAELSRSEELRLELEALRAVSGAVKGLPKAALPAGFAARLEARRYRERAKPEREYILLPPSYRPVAFALSSVLVALVVWEKVRPPVESVRPRSGWDSERPPSSSIKSAADAPPSIDVSGRLGAASDELSREPAAKEDAPSTLGKQLNAPGKPVEITEDKAPAPEAFDGSFSARNEEERSAINERLYKGFEDEKKRMGIARILEKDAEDGPSSPARGMTGMQAAPGAASAGRRSSLSAVRGAPKAKAAAPAVKALALRSVDALHTAWAAAGLPGQPPAIAFPGQMAIFLAGPAGSGIVSVQDRKKFIVVLYRDSGFEDDSARVRAVPLSQKPVVIKPAE